MGATLVYRGRDHDTAEGIARGIQSTGGRAVAAHWFDESFTYSFKDMSEAEIEAWLDHEWDRLDARRSSGVRA